MGVGGEGGLTCCPRDRSWCLGVLRDAPGVSLQFHGNPTWFHHSLASPLASRCATAFLAAPRLTPGHISRIPGELWTVTIGTRSQKGNNNKTKQNKKKPSPSPGDTLLLRTRVEHGELMRARPRRAFPLALGQLAVTACFIFGGRNHRLTFQSGGSRSQPVGLAGGSRGSARGVA